MNLDGWISVRVTVCSHALRCRMFISTVKRLRVLKSSELSDLSRKFTYKLSWSLADHSRPLRGAFSLQMDAGSIKRCQGWLSIELNIKKKLGVGDDKTIVPRSRGWNFSSFWLFLMFKSFLLCVSSSSSIKICKERSELSMEGACFLDISWLWLSSKDCVFLFVCLRFPHCFSTWARKNGKKSLNQTKISIGKAPIMSSRSLSAADTIYGCPSMIFASTGSVGCVSKTLGGNYCSERLKIDNQRKCHLAPGNCRSNLSTLLDDYFPAKSKVIGVSWKWHPRAIRIVFTSKV